MVCRSWWWGQCRPLAFDLGLCLSLVNVWFTEPWPHIPSPWQWQSSLQDYDITPKKRRWGGGRWWERRRRVGRGSISGSTKPLQHPSRSPSIQRGRRKRKAIIVIIVLPVPLQKRGGANRVRNWCSQQVPTSERKLRVREAGNGEESVKGEDTPSSVRKQTSGELFFSFSSFSITSFCKFHLCLHENHTYRNHSWRVGESIKIITKSQSTNNWIYFK